MKKIILKNNITVFLHKTEDILCGISAWFDAGAVYDPEEKAGLAHLFEHVKFFNKNRITNTDIKLRAFTGYDYTEISCAFLSVDAKKVLENIVSIINTPVDLPTDEIEKEKQIIFAEKQEVQSEFLGMMWQLRQNLLWTQDKLGNNFFGTQETLNTITREDLISYNDNYIQNSNSLKIFIYGSLDEDMVKEQLSKIEVISTDSIDYSISDTNSNQKNIEVKGKTNAVGIHIKIKDISLEKYRILCLLREILANNQISLLNQELRYSKGYTYGVYGTSGLYKSEGFMSFCYSVSKEHRVASVASIKAIILNLNKYLSDDLVRRVKDSYVLTLLSNNYTPVDRAYFYGENYKNMHTLESVEEFCEKIQVITLIEIKNFISDFIKEDQVYQSDIVSN